MTVEAGFAGPQSLVLPHRFRSTYSKDAWKSDAAGLVLSEGIFAPRTPQHGLSRAAAPARFRLR